MDNENFVTNFIEFYKHNGGKIKKFRGGWLILCPYHSDSDPSLAIYLNGGCYCFACRKPYKLGAVMGAYGYSHELVETDPEPELRHKMTPQDEASITDTKWYLYADGKKVFYRCRVDYEKNGTTQKAFYFYEVAFENGKEIIKLVKGYVPLMLYHLPEIEQEKEVFFVEGEKCVDALWGLGLPATTLPVGATTKFNKEILEALIPLKDKKVFVIPDNDEQGKKYARSITKTLKQIGSAPEIVYIPDLGDKSDIADYIGFLKLQGFTNEKIRSEILKLTEADSGMPFDQIEAKPTEWSITDWIPKGKLTILAGREGTGKTRLALVLACAKANGTPIFTAKGFKEVTQGQVFYFSLEDDLSNLASWCDTAGLKRSPNMKVFEPEGFYEIKNKISRYKPELAIIDPASYLISEEKSLEGVKPILEPLVKLARENYIAIVAVWHQNKRDTSDVGLAISGHNRISAMAKRLIVLERQENKIAVHFRKTKKTESVAFVVDENKFEWVGSDGVENFGSHIPHGREIATLIRQELEKGPNKALSFNDIIKLASPFGISKDYLKIIKDRYLKDVISKPVRKEGKFVGWFWQLPEYHPKNDTLAKSVDNPIFLPEYQFSNDIPQQELTVKNSLKINDLQTQEKNNCKKTENDTLDKTVDNSNFEPEYHKKNDTLVKMAKKNNNSLKNQDFFKLTVPIVPEEIAKKYKIENPKLYEDPDFRQIAINHITSYSKQNRNNSDELPVIVIDGVEYVDADELFKREGLAC